MARPADEALMFAAVRIRYGAPDAVRITRLPRPVPGDRDLLVAVHTSTVNRTDSGYRAGKPFIVRVFAGLARPKAAVLGCEFAGRVAASGCGVTRFEVGDRVFGYCEGRFGAHAEYVVVREDSPVARIPAGVDFEHAACGTEGAHYALSLLRAASVGKGKRVLVYGATGAIGSAAVQLAKAVGAYVTAVCDTPRVELVRGLGPDRVVDHLTEDFTAKEQRYDVVLDAVGKSTFGRCRRLLTRRGIYLSTDLGPWSQNLLLALLTSLGRHRKVLFPIPSTGQAMIEELAELMAAGRFEPVIDRTYPIEQITDAYRYVETGGKTGNVLISIESSLPDMGRPQKTPPLQYHAGRWQHAENVVMRALVRAGLVPHTYVLTTRGRKTGRPRRNPVTLVEREGRRWLVAPYGPVPWVLNARAAGQVSVSRRGKRQRFGVHELPPDEAAPVLKQYLRIARVTQPYFYARPASPAEEFAAEARLHPVFELTAITDTTRA